MAINTLAIRQKYRFFEQDIDQYFAKNLFFNAISTFCLDRLKPSQYLQISINFRSIF
jgi:hypothetical protein